TMNVLSATAKTPLIEVNIYKGMRTMARNLAVEKPEPDVGVSHYRGLFLSALLLLTFSFVMNILEELIRQRLRNKYATL
ncbi:ABC transporter permease subunit, partial [Pseudomonas aeruginosa]